MNNLIVQNNDIRQKLQLHDMRPTCQLNYQLSVFKNRTVQIWNYICSITEIIVTFVEFKFYCKQFLIVLMSYDI